MSNIEIIDLQQNTPEWLAFRQNYIGASDASAVMGVGFDTPYQLWQYKLGLLPPKEETEAMRRGKEKEEVARQEFIKLKGINMNPCVAKNLTYPFLCASLDGAYLQYHSHGAQVRWAVEIKVPGRQDHEMAMDGVIPEKYTWQLLQQMIVCDLQSIFYFSWNETSNNIIEFHRDEAMEKAYLPKAKEFWDCVQNLKEPPLCDRDYVNKDDDVEWWEASRIWKEAKENREGWEQRERDYRQKLLELAGDQCCQGNNVRLTKYMVRGRIDNEAIFKDYGVDKEKYRKSNTVAWRVS
jgi:putative phage-type endonuclease